MPEFKPSTLQVISKSEDILNLLKSDIYKNQISGSDISTQSSPYKVGDQTLQDAIDSIEVVCKLLLSQKNQIDKIDYNQRNNFSNYLTNIYNWLSAGVISNWSNIISYSNSLYQWVFQYGFNEFSGINRNIIDKVKKIEIKEDEIQKIKSLRDELQQIKNASDNLSRANEINGFVSVFEPVEELSKYVFESKERSNEIERKIEKTEVEVREKLDSLLLETKEKINNILGASSDAKIQKHFEDVNQRYQESVWGKNIENDKWIKRFFGQMLGWSGCVVLGIILFILNIFIVIFVKDSISITASELSNEYIRLLANGTIRGICLAPSIMLLTFITDNYVKNDELRRIYEFKSVASKALEGHIAVLQNRKVHEDVIADFSKNVLAEIYSEPKTVSLNGKIDKNENNILSQVKAVSFAKELVEKFRDVK